MLMWFSSRLYSAVSLTLVKEQRFIRFFIIIITNAASGRQVAQTENAKLRKG